MDAADIMTPKVISVQPDTPVSDVVKLMLDNRISAVPVLDGSELVGIISEGDLVRRAELRTERRRSRWLQLFASSADLAAEYAKTHGRKAREVMTEDVVTVREATPIAEIADLLESRHIKRVPVMRDGTVVGIVSRANLLQALASLPSPPGRTTADDRRIRQALVAELSRRKWADVPTEWDLIVKDGVVHLWGVIDSDAERKAMIVAAENIPGVRAVEDHMSYPVPTGIG